MRTSLRKFGISAWLSTDRRAVKILKLITASAVLCGRSSANASDLWVLRYVWDREEQIAPLAALVAGLLEAIPEPESPHPLAGRPDRPDSEALAKQLDDAERVLASGTLTLIELVRLREQVTNVSDRAEWVTDTVGREHLLTCAGGLLEKIGE